jgi:glycosyltransferase involved in cell wall biosynthesis
VHKNLRLYLELCRLHPQESFAAVLNSSYVREFEVRGELPPNLRIFSAITSSQYIDLLLSSQMLISTSLKEGYGMPPMEAALLGVPILVSDIPIYRELYSGVAEFFDLNLDSLDTKFRILKGIPGHSPVSAENLAKLRHAQGHTQKFVDAIAPLFARQ